MKSETRLQIIGMTVQKLADEQDLSRRDLSKLAGIHVTTVANIMRGKYHGNLHSFFSLLDALGYDMESFGKECKRFEKLLEEQGKQR